MPPETAERRPITTKGGSHHVGAPPPADKDPLPCPRCHSNHTKFCYYNNYNFSQPRHFCKSCRRYWTHGGTLRDIPIGGGSRRNAKRSRTTTTFLSSTSSVNSSVISSPLNYHNPNSNPIPSTPLFVSLSTAASVAAAAAASPAGTYVSDVLLKPASAAEGFTSLLNLNAAGSGFLALGGCGFGLGLGLGSELEDAGFGPLGRGVWSLPEVGYLSGSGGGGGGSTWEVESGGVNGLVGGAAGGDCFSSPLYPELAISTTAGKGPQ